MKYSLLILLAFGFLLSACSLSKKKCPIPSCKISKMHQHALIFTNEGKAKKAKKKIKKELSDSTSVGDEGVADEVMASDSTQVDTSSKKKKKDKKKKKKKNKDSEEELLLTDEEKQLLEESGESIEPAKKKKEKKKKKKKKEKDEVDELGAETGDELTDEEKAILEEENADDADDLKLSAREIRKADKEARAEEKRAKKEEKEKDPFNVAYRSRITPWWGKDQHPEVGEDWKRTKKVYKQPDERKARKLFRNLFGYPTR